MKLRTIRPTAKIRRKKPPVKLNATAARRRSHAEEFEDEEEDYYETAEPNMKLSHAFIVVLILHLIAVAGVFGFNSMKNRQSALAKISAESSAAQAATSTEVHAAASAGAASTTIASAQEAATHTIAAGDTLTRIAARYNTTIEALEKANGLTADSILRVGQVLQLPEKGAAVAVAAATNPAAPSAAAPVTAVTTRTSAPSASPAPTTSAQQTATAATGIPAGLEEQISVYEVVAGDNPYSIARRLGVSYQALLELNNIEDPTKLQIGQKLKIPGR